jgi:hypothetical protein
VASALLGRYSAEDDVEETLVPFSLRYGISGSSHICGYEYYDFMLRYSMYEESRLLGYKIPVRTSQETHYVSATELSRLMLCKI